MSSTDTSEDRKTIKLSVHCPIRPPSPASAFTASDGRSGTPSSQVYGSPDVVYVDAIANVKQLKVQLENDIEGNPKPEGQTLIWRGRRLKDDEVVGKLIAELEGPEPPEQGYPLHLSVQPGAWRSSAADPNNAGARAAAERLAALSSSLATGQQPAQIQGIPASTAFPTSSIPHASTLASQPPPPTPGAPLLRPLASPADTPFNFNGPLDAAGASPFTTTLAADVFAPHHHPLGVSSSPYPSLPNVMAGTSTSHPQSPWRTFSDHLQALSTSQRGLFMARISQAERYYDTLIRVQQQRQGHHLGPVDAGLLDQLKDSGQLGRTVSSHEVEARTEGLLEAVGLMEQVRRAAETAKQAFEQSVAAQREMLGGYTNSQVVYIGGYPFLLQIPERFAVPYEKRLEGYVQLRKFQAIHEIISTMLLTARREPAHFPSSAPVSNVYTSTRALGPFADASSAVSPYPPGTADANNVRQRPPFGEGALGAMGVGANGAQNLLGQIPGLPPAMAGRAAAGPGFTPRLAIVINLDEILALAVPLFFLTLKLSFLIYIFARHASNKKRAIMISLALAWLVWEGISIRRRRRAADMRRREQAQQQIQGQFRQMQQQGQDRNGGAGDPAGNARQPQQQPFPPNGQLQGLNIPNVGPGIAQRLRERQEQRAVRRREHRAGQGQAGSGSSSSSHRHRTPPNRLSPKYWMSVIAKVGLSEEAREMGIHRSSSSSSRSSSSSSSVSNQPPPASQARPPPATLKRFLRIVVVFFVLFFGTLVPEVERLRKKALDKRERKLKELENARIAYALAQQQQQQQQQQRASQSDTTALQGPSNGGQLRIEGGQDARSADSARRLNDAAVQQRSTTDKDDNAPLLVPINSSQHSTPDASSGSAAQAAHENPAEQNATKSTPHQSSPQTSAPDESTLFDPPFDEATISAALVSGAHRSSPEVAGTALSGEGLEASGTTSDRAPDLQSDSSAQGNPAQQPNTRPTVDTDLLTTHAAGDESLPLTPLLSPTPSAVESDEDDTAEDAEQAGGDVDDEVGMILF